MHNSLKADAKMHLAQGSRDCAAWLIPLQHSHLLFADAAPLRRDTYLQAATGLKSGVLRCKCDFECCPLYCMPFSWSSTSTAGSLRICAATSLSNYGAPV